MKYYNAMVVFEEIPNEITLAINITNCPCHCKGCHSKFLWEDVGTELDGYAIDDLVKKNNGVTCVCFMGGDANHKEIADLSEFLHMTTDKKVAMYSGDEEIDNLLVDVLDYYKVGPYIKEKGPLTDPNTNQRLYLIKNKELIDITYKFINTVQ